MTWKRCSEWTWLGFVIKICQCFAASLSFRYIKVTSSVWIVITRNQNKKAKSRVKISFRQTSYRRKWKLVETRRSKNLYMSKWGLLLTLLPDFQLNTDGWVNREYRQSRTSLRLIENKIKYIRVVESSGSRRSLSGSNWPLRSRAVHEKLSGKSLPRYNPLTSLERRPEFNCIKVT